MSVGSSATRTHSDRLEPGERCQSQAFCEKCKMEKKIKQSIEKEKKNKKIETKQIFAST